MSATSQRHALLASALAMSLQGCASIGGDTPKAELNIRPARVASASVSVADGLYNDAVTAINRRDYARALDLLQVARERTPNDARVLNAFGVVYDKLGRFDLSGRYYAQAAAADPGSAIVAQNQAYSQTLRVEITPLADATAPPSAPSVQVRARTVADIPARKLPAFTVPVEAPGQSVSAASSLAALPAPRTARYVVPSSPALSVASAEPLVVRLAPAVRQPLLQTPAPQWRPPSVDVSAPASTAHPTVGAEASQRLAKTVPKLPAVATPAPPKQALRLTALRPVAPAGASKAHPVPPEAPVRLIDIRARPTESKPAPVFVHAPLAKSTSTLGTATAAPQPAARSRRPALMGRPVQVLYNGAGKRSADQLRAQLSRRGWTLAVANVRSTAPAQTTIRYAPANERVALALARSLRIPVKLERCRARCSGVIILVGQKRTLRMVGAPSRSAAHLG